MYTLVRTLRMGKFHRLHYCPAPEHLVLNQIYAITLNPKFPAKLPKYSKELHRVFSQMNGVERVVLHPEHSPNGRLHYHGEIVFNDKYQWYDNDIHILMDWGAFEIDTINNPEKWKVYCTKCSDYIIEALKTMKLPYPFVWNCVDRVMSEQKVKYKYAETIQQFDEQFVEMEKRLGFIENEEYMGVAPSSVS